MVVGEGDSPPASKAAPPPVAMKEEAVAPPASVVGAMPPPAPVVGGVEAPPVPGPTTESSHAAAVKSAVGPRRTLGVDTRASHVMVTPSSAPGIRQNRSLDTDAGDSGGVTGGDGTIAAHALPKADGFDARRSPLPSQHTRRRFEVAGLPNTTVPSP